MSQPHARRPLPPAAPAVVTVAAEAREAFSNEGTKRLLDTLSPPRSY